MSLMMSPSPSMQGPTGGNIGTTNSGYQRDIVPKGYRLGQLGRFTPEQSQLFSQLFSHLGPDSFIGRVARGDQSQFEGMEQPAWRDFQSSIGGLASRFSGMGSGARQSSGFQNASTQAAQDFATALQQQRTDLQGRALRELFEMSNLLLSQQPTEKFLTQKAPKAPSFLQQLGLSLAGSLSGGASQLGTMYGGKKLGLF